LHTVAVGVGGGGIVGGSKAHPVSELSHQAGSYGSGGMFSVFQDLLQTY